VRRACKRCVFLTARRRQSILSADDAHSSAPKLSRKQTGIHRVKGSMSKSDPKPKNLFCPFQVASHLLSRHKIGRLDFTFNDPVSHWTKCHNIPRSPCSAPVLQRCKPISRKWRHARAMRLSGLQGWGRYSGWLGHARNMNNSMNIASACNRQSARISLKKQGRLYGAPRRKFDTSAAWHSLRRELRAIWAGLTRFRTALMVLVCIGHFYTLLGGVTLAG